MNTMKKQVKGFTLIELIVVMAIFGTILASAMALIQPSSKVLSNAQNQESGNAAVSNISSFLENELSSVEYLSVINDAASTPNTGYIEEYVKSYYEGVLKAGSTVDHREYGEGDIHMMVVNNNDNGRITRYTYHVSFTPGDFDITLKDTQEVNKAYYNDYYFTIRAGLYENEDDFEDGEETYQTLLNSITSKNTQFTIRTVVKCKCPSCGHEFPLNYGVDHCPSCGQHITKKGGSFLSTAAMSLVNIYNRSTSGVSGRYYVVNEAIVNNAGEEPGIVKSIMDITNPAMTKKGTSQEVEHLNGAKETLTSNSDRQAGYVMLGTKVYYAGENTNGYTFIYSYGSEIKTS